MSADQTQLGTESLTKALDGAKHPTMHRIALITKNILAQSVSEAKAEKFWVTQSETKWIQGTLFIFID